jgi:hypothetical protein
MGDDVILCRITSQAKADRYAIRLDDPDFESGGLSQSSRIRPNRLFVGDSATIVYRAGHVSNAKTGETLDHLIQILKEG